MLRKLLVAIALLLHMGLVFAQNSIKPPPSPFSFQNGQTTLREGTLPNDIRPLIVDSSVQTQANAGNQTQINLMQAFQEAGLAPEKPFDPKVLDKLSDDVVQVFEDKMSEYGTKLIPYTLRLFYTLLILGILLSTITQMIFGANFKDICTSLLMVFFIAGFWLLLIENWVSWGSWLANYFVKIGLDISDVAFQPSAIFKYGANYMKHIFRSLVTMDFGMSMMYILLSIPTFYLIIQIMLAYIGALFEFIIIGKMSVIYLAFAGIRFTEGYAKKPIMYCLSCGLKLMFLQLFFGAVLGIIIEYSTKPINDGSVIVMFGVSVLLNAFVQKLPALVDTFIHGSTSATSGGSLRHMTRAFIDTGLGTARAIMSAIDSKKMLQQASQLASQTPAWQRPNFNEDNYQKHRQDILAQQNKDNANASSGSNSDSLNQSSATNLNNNANTKNDTQTSQQTSLNNFAHANATNQNNTQAAQAPTSNDMHQQALGNNNTTTGTSTASNSNTPNATSAQSTKNSLNHQYSMGASLAHGLKTTAHMAGALIKNDFSLDKANHMLENKLNKKHSVNAEQQRVWDKIYSGKSPDDYTQALKYIEHGNAMEKDQDYANQFNQYVEFRSKLYQHEQNNINTFEQQANNIISTDNSTTNIKEGMNKHE